MVEVTASLPSPRLCYNKIKQKERGEVDEMGRNCRITSKAICVG